MTMTTATSPAAAEAGSPGEEKPWVDSALQEARALKDSLATAADSAAIAASSGLSEVLSVSSAGIQEAKGLVEWVRSQYVVYEDLAVGKVKEGIVIAASNPGITCGLAAGMGMVVFKKPRRFLIRNTRRLFMSEESLLSDAEAKVNKLQQSVNLVKNESIKLEERALKAEEEMQRGRMALTKEGREIQGELRFVNRIERETMGLKDLISELPRRDASQFRSEVSALSSQVQQVKKALTAVAGKIVNHGIPI